MHYQWGKIIKGISTCSHQLLQLDLRRNLCYRNFVGKQYVITVQDVCSRWCAVIHFKRDFCDTEELINPLKMTENYFSNREGYKVAAVRMCQRALFVSSALYVFFEGKGIEAHIKWWNPAQVSRTVPSNALVALLNKGPIAHLPGYRFSSPLWTETMSFAVYFIDRLSGYGQSGAVLYYF